MTVQIDVDELVRHGVAVVVATRDAEHRPELGRAWGPALSDDERLTICVEAPPDSAMAHNLSAGNPVAATLSRLSAGHSVQFKGHIVEVGAPTPDRLAAVESHIDSFVAETAAVGVPETIARGFAGRQLLTVTIAVRERYDASPGDRTDTPL